MRSPGSPVVGTKTALAVFVLFFSSAAVSAPIVLPGEADTKAPVSCAPFPDRMSAYVWRNWFCVPRERLAETVGATVAELTAVAGEMGLPADPMVEPEWTRKGYVTILRRNWHLLDYPQLMKLLGIDRAELNYRLLEDDFLFAKFGNVKPKCGALVWDAAANAKTREARRKLAQILSEEGVDAAAPCEPRFGFLRDLAAVPPDARPAEDPDRHFDLRLQFSYFADYADPLADDEIGSFPEGLLARYAACGVNAVWLHVVLRTLAKDPFFVEFGEGAERRQRNLRKLVDRAARYGIRVYLYLNEPRPMPCAFFEKNDAYRACRGTLEWRGIVNAMCTRSPEVRRWLGSAVEQVFRAAPGLGGVLTISGSENLTHCLAHGPKSVYENDPGGYCKPEKFCRRCEKLTMDESVADLNRVIADGVRRADPSARVIVWDWGWHEPGRPELDTVTSAIARLKGSGVSFMTVSERDKPIDVGGVAVRLNEYALSQVGPSELSLAKWRAADAAGLPSVAKAQVASSWEMAVVPYVPVMDNVAEHAFNLMKAGVKGAMLSWSCGCYPAPNLEVFTGVRTTDRSAADALDRVAVARYGQKAAPDVRRVWTLLSKGFSNLPFYSATLHRAPHHWGPANPLYAEPTGYASTMVGIPYDDLKTWRSVFPADVYIAKTRETSAAFESGAAAWKDVIAKTEGEARRTAVRELGIIRTIALHYASAADQAAFVLARDRGDREEMAAVARRELARAKELLPLVEADARLGYECSCHYFYVPQDLREKVVNCRQILEGLGAPRHPVANDEELALFRGHLGAFMTTDTNGFKVCRHWKNGAHTEWEDCNYDERAVKPYVLDDPFTFLDGRKVVTAADWTARRREILELFQSELYGRLPPPPEALVVEKTSEKVTADGFAIERRYRISFKADKSGPSVEWYVLLPRHAKGRVPVFLHLNYKGNDWIASGKTNHYTLPLEQFIARGYAFMSACYTDYTSDPGSKREWDATAYDGVFRLWGRRNPAKRDNTGAIMAWAWGFMRGLDLAERIPEIDATRSVVIGSSRLGKAAIVAGAFDDRFAVCIPNQTGAVGVQVMKRDFGENAKIQQWIFPHWYCLNFWKYRDDPAAQKFDQHLLLACVAPRALLIEGHLNDWYDPKGEFVAAKAASPVWEFLSGRGLGCSALPPPFCSDFVRPPLGFASRAGAHGLSGYDWKWALDFADRALAERTPPAVGPDAACGTTRTYLSGRGCDDAVPWSFSVDAGRRAGEKTTIPVPSCWEMQGFGELLYGNDVVSALEKKARGEAVVLPTTKVTGTYRRTFAAPEDSANRHTDLCFEAVFTDCEVFLNGEKLGGHRGGFYPFRFDVTGRLRPENELVVKVVNESADESVNRAERRGDYWNFGGIWRPVYLETKPLKHIVRVAVDARADGTLEADLFVSDGTVRHVSEKWEDPKLWTAETPNLHEKAFELRDDDGRLLHRVVKKIGFRTVSAVRGDSFRINGKRVTVKGVNRHAFRPETGRTLSRAKNEEDVRLIKSLNMNAVRCSHYPPDPDFLDLCDELGLYVVDELCGWQKAIGTEPGLPLARAMVARDQAHPSVIWWANGNEGGYNFALDPVFAELDPQKRPLLHPDSEFGVFHTKHYRNYERTKPYLTNDWIFLPTEFQHGLYDGGHAAGLGELWKLMSASKQTAGGFLWDLRDQGVRREDGTLDCCGNYGADGLVGPHDEETGSCDAVREIWSPVMLSLKGRTLSVGNRYDFTDLSETKIAWESLSFAQDTEKTVAHGVLTDVVGAPHGTTCVDLPAEATGGDAVRLVVRDRTGEKVLTRVFATGDAAPAKARTSDVPPSFVPRLVAYVGSGKRPQEFTPVAADFTWTMTTNADRSVDCRWTIRTTNAVDLLGVTFDVDGTKVVSKKWLGKGPYRVWRNRPEGPQLGVWENAFNGGAAGVTWNLPEFKGFFAETRWMSLTMKDGTALRFDLLEPAPAVGVLTPEDGADKYLFELPELGVSVLEVVPAIGNKFTAPKDVCPSGTSVTVPCEIRGGVRLSCTAAPGVKPMFRAYRSFNRQFERTSDFAKMGVKTRCFFASNSINSRGTPYCEYPLVWTRPGQYDFTAYDRQADDLIKASPEADFLVMVDLTMPYWMTRPFCGDAYEHVTDYCRDARWRRDVAAFMKALLAHSEKRYGKRVKGYILSGGKTSEWYEFEDGHSSGRKDKAWREWCAENGKTGYKPYCPPGPMRFQAAFEGTVYDPATQAELLDYWRFHNEIITDAILFFAREARAALPSGKQIGVFFGYYLVNNFRETSFGHLDYLRVFDSPDIDFVVAPGNYSDRVPGGASGSQCAYGSAFLRGKRLLHEIDCWPHGHPMGWGGYFKTAADDLAGNTREAAFALVNHLSSWWFDMWGGFYDDPALRARIGRLEKIQARFEKDLSPSVAEVLFVCDPDSARYINEESKLSDRLYRDFYNRAVRTGAPVDVYSFDDLPRLDLARYKVAILAASVNLTSEKAVLLKRTLCRDGRLLVFAYAPGLSDGRTLDVRRVCDWAGVDFGTPGVSVTDRGGWKAAYAADPALYTSEKLAELYAAAGVHRYVDELCPVYANTRLVSVHSATGGKKRIRLPARVREAVDLLAERAVLTDGDSFESDFATPDTKIFEINR